MEGGSGTYTQIFTPMTKNGLFSEYSAFQDKISLG